MATTAPNSNVSSASVDGRRAQQLVERAMSLAERNDLPAAVLACRQSIALAPESSAGYSMLGLLLERAGDSGGAIASYEKVLQLAPDSLLERESLGRLRVTAAQRRTTRDLFVFDDTELFGDERPEHLPTSNSNGAAKAASTPAGDGGDSVSQSVLKASAAQTVANIFKKPASEPFALVPIETPVAPENAPPSAQAAIAADAIAVATVASSAAGAVAAPMVTKPIITAPSAGSTQAAKAAFPFPTATPRGNATPSRPPQVAPANVDWPTQKLTLIQKLKQHPSFYFRAAPLAATAVLSLGVLLWTYSYASSRSSSQVAPDVDYETGTPTVMIPEGDLSRNVNNPPVSSTTPGATNTGAVSSGVPANPAAPATTTAATPKTSARSTAPRVATNSGVPTNPSTPAPASQTPAAPPTAGGDKEIYPPMPQPRLGAASAPDDTVRITSPGSDGASSGGTPVNPGGPGAGYVRVAPSGSAVRAPVRPENTATSDERAATTSARAGDSDAAITRMTRSIESGGGDTAFRYQQRAQLYLQNGDAARAINDFNAAIAAYNDMIARGERVSAAQAGIRSSQRGIQLAQARR